MRQLSADGQKIVEDVAMRHGFSVNAVTAMLHAVAVGGGSMAQFDHPEFGGMGQWSRGGMTMIGDMFNNALKSRVDGLCAELAGLLARQPQPPNTGVPFQNQMQSQGGFGSGFLNGAFSSEGSVSLFVPLAGRGAGGWWPAELGQPSSTGQQNDIRYAVFPATQRLAIDVGGRLSVYDTLDHHIGGVSQQQSGDASLSFTSQYGLVRVTELPLVSGSTPGPDPVPASQPAPADAAPVSPSPPPLSPQAAPPVAPPMAADAGSADEIFGKLERLAALRDKGIVSEDEFTAKKAELLARL